MNLSLQKKARGLFDGSLITTSGTPLAQLRTESVVSRDVIYLALLFRQSKSYIGPVDG